MKQSAYGKPILIDNNGQISNLAKIFPKDELTIQELIFKHPSCLPISDIDETYNPVVPVCTELNTTVGPMDILMVSPNGYLTIIETKLWKNPEARRVVIAQILDYANELSSWSYEDLQRETNRRNKTEGNNLYEIVKKASPELTLSESDFIDSVSRNLQKGKFLLIVAGDGIKEGAAGIAEFLTNMGHLNFSLAMIELSLYKAEGMGTLIVPKTLIKTTEINRMIVEIPPGFVLNKNDEEELTISESKILAFQRFGEPFTNVCDFIFVKFINFFT